MTENRNPEYMPWYHPGSDMLRCSGDNGCGALVVEGDIEVHNRWHRKITGKDKSNVAHLPRKAG